MFIMLSLLVFLGLLNVALLFLVLAKQKALSEEKMIKPLLEETKNNFLLLKNDLLKDSGETRAVLTELVTQKNANLNESVLQRMKEVDAEFSAKLTKFAQTINEWRAGMEASVNKTIKEDFDRIRQLMDEKLKDINQQVQTNIEENFKKTTQTFQSVLERLVKIDEAQKNIEGLSKNVLSLQDVLMDKRSRGAFGEVQLHQVLDSVFGSNHEFYQLQHTLENRSDGTKKPDAVLFFPEPTGKVCVDSKFPLENYQKMLDSTRSEEERKVHERLFISDIKSRINEVEKYIVQGETADFAIMFIPSEAIFAEILGKHQDIGIFAQKKKVFIASPTTLLAICNTVHATMMKIQISKNAEVIKQHLAKLSEEFKRHYDRWTKLEKQLETVSTTTKEVGTTSRKIRERFEEINSSRNIDTLVGPDEISTEQLKIGVDNGLFEE